MTSAIVIGAGIQGATVAYEATRRGCDVVLVDRGDLAGAASSNSMRVAHGGLRYLSSLDVKRSLESIRERRRWLQRAPDHTEIKAFAIDLEGRSIFYKGALRAGLLVNEVLSATRNRGVRPDRRLPIAHHPVWYDAMFIDTERILLSLLHTARNRGSGALEVLTHDAVVAVLDSPERARGVRLESGRSIEADWVIRCIGAHDDSRPAVSAMNLVVPRLPLCSRDRAAGFFHPDDGRNLFVVPWGGVSIVGTWNREFDGDSSRPFSVDANEVDDMLRWLEPVHPELGALNRGDVLRVHAGLLPRDRGSRSPEPAHRSEITEIRPGLIDVVGVKWTTAWRVAEKTVDRILGPQRDLETGPLDDGRRAREAYVAGAEGRDRVLPGGSGRLRVGDIGFAIEHEWARDLSDVLLRRTATATAGHPGRKLVEAAANVAQPLLDWSDSDRRRQVEEFNDDPLFAGNVPD